MSRRRTSRPAADATTRGSAATVMPVGRRLPALRAVVGAMLVTAAAALVVVAHRQAVNEPQTHFVAAAVTVSAGTQVASVRHARELFGSVAVDLPPAVADRSVAVDDLASLVGQIIAAPMEPGDLLHRTVVVEQLPDPAHLLTVALTRHDALNGRVRPGERVDVLATITEAGTAATVFVARNVTVAAVDIADQGAFASESVVLTLRLESAEMVQAVGHAARAAAMFLSRPAAEAEQELPPPFRLSTAAPSSDVLKGTNGGSSEAPERDERIGDQPDSTMDPWDQAWGETGEPVPFHGQGSPPTWWPAP